MEETSRWSERKRDAEEKPPSATAAPLLKATFQSGSEEAYRLPPVQKAADRTVTSQRPQISKVGIKSFSEDFNVLLPCLARIFTVIPFFFFFCNKPKFVRQ